MNLLTVDDLAARWQVTKEYLNAMRSKGDGPRWVDISGKGSAKAIVRYPSSEIEKYERTKLVSISDKERIRRKFPVRIKNRKPSQSTLKLSD